MKRFGFKRWMSGVLLTVMLLTGACGAAGIQSNAKEGMKAVWVSTVYQLDYPSGNTDDPARLKAEADSILENSKAMGMNAVMLQVRPSADAFYPSSIFPWSRYLTGQAGKAPKDQFDPLAYWVEKAHALGLELHAWINPYRITKAKTEEYNALPDSSPAKQHPEWVVLQADGNYYFDPGIPEVREMVIKGAEEIVANYAVDGLHLDDYFYPNKTFLDEATFAKYGAGYQSIGDWRRENVNLLVKELGQRLHKLNPKISYGISPAGIWANQKNQPEGSKTNGYETYYNNYADSRKWVKEGWIDYICPQLYWVIGNTSADYGELAQWWSKVTEGTGVKLYIGMADYQACNTNPSSPWYGTDAIRAQLDKNRQLKVAGEVHFRYQLMAQKPQLVELYRQYYANSQPPSEGGTTQSGVQLNKTQHMAYMQGSGGKFEPQSNLTRAQAVTMLARLTVDASGNSLFQDGNVKTAFSDVPQEAWYSAEVAFAAKYGIVKGYADGTFKPDQTITRAEFIKMIAGYQTLSGASAAAFSDVPANYWAAKEIGWAQSQGWAGGYEDGTFRPQNKITRAEAVKLLNGALDRKPDVERIQAMGSLSFADVPMTHWAYYEIMEAAVSHDYYKHDGGESWKTAI